MDILQLIVLVQVMDDGRDEGGVFVCNVDDIGAFWRGLSFAAPKAYFRDNAQNSCGVASNHTHCASATH